MRGVIKREDIDFPEKLFDLKPKVKEIYFSGNKELLYKPCIAVVGSRKCTTYGKTVARAIGKRVAESGAVLVSGLAKGIDTAAHMGAIEGGGNTIAVLANGLDFFYPSENRNLQINIEEQGLLISEYSEGNKPLKHCFPLRNRIISGICESVVIVEACQGSGALITAELAVEQGRKLYAVPGNITSFFSYGTNLLIRDNISPLVLIDDLFYDLNITPAESEKKRQKLGKDEKLICKALEENGELSIEEIYHKTNIKPSEINGIMTILEMKGVIFSSSGKFFLANF